MHGLFELGERERGGELVRSWRAANTWQQLLLANAYTATIKQFMPEDQMAL